MHDKCFVCATYLGPFEFNPGPSGTFIQCRVCGFYRIYESAAVTIKDIGINERWLVSAAIREHQGSQPPAITSWEALLGSVIPPKDLLECIDRLLLHILRNVKASHETVGLDPDYDYPTAYASSPEEFRYLLSKAVELSFLETMANNSRYRLNLKGWERVAHLKSEGVKSRQAFVAMSFQEGLYSAWEVGFAPALRRAGYEPIRIDLEPHNDQITDKVISEIRRSGLVIADCTGQKQNVYFEGGLAMGLGVPVIWTCRADDRPNIHFDIQGYNFIVWTDAEELSEKLFLRVEATLPLKAVRK